MRPDQLKPVNIIHHLPNLFTLCNLISGCVGIVFVLEDRSVPAAYFVWIAALFDFADGFTARLLQFTSPMGKELDSLADVVSFGVLPSCVLYKFGNALPLPVPYLGFLIAAFSALRLAVFNVDTTQSDSFRGLPTPANALWITALPFLPSGIQQFLLNPPVYIMLCASSAALLVSQIRLFALKFKNLKWEGNQMRFTFLIGSVLFFVFMGIQAMPLVILSYLVLSLFVRDPA